MEREQTPRRVPIRELVRYYLRLGLLGFGGPVALVGQMEREMVGERKWLTKEEMREGIGRLSIPPGTPRDPGRHLDFLHPRRLLGCVGRRVGVHPAELHHRRGARGALRPLRRAAMGDGHLLRREPGGYRADPALLLPAHETRDEGLAGMGARGSRLRHYRCCAGRSRTGLHRLRDCRCPVLRVALPRTRVRFHDALAPCRRTAPGGGRWRVPVGAMLGKLLAFFLKAGSLTFGSGLVIVPFLEKGLVQQTGWLTEREFLVAVAMGMISPGPVVITATFVGYLVAGFWGSSSRRSASSCRRSCSS